MPPTLTATRSMIAVPRTPARRHHRQFRHRAPSAAAEPDVRSGPLRHTLGFPTRPFNWSLYVFYGGDVREEILPWLCDQMSDMGALQHVDENGDMPVAASC